MRFSCWHCWCNILYQAPKFCRAFELLKYSLLRLFTGFGVDDALATLSTWCASVKYACLHAYDVLPRWSLRIQLFNLILHLSPIRLYYTVVSILFTRYNCEDSAESMYSLETGNTSAASVSSLRKWRQATLRNVLRRQCGLSWNYFLLNDEYDSWAENRHNFKHLYLPRSMQIFLRLLSARAQSSSFPLTSSANGAISSIFGLRESVRTSLEQ